MRGSGGGFRPGDGRGGGGHRHPPGGGGYHRHPGDRGGGHRHPPGGGGGGYHRHPGGRGRGRGNQRSCQDHSARESIDLRTNCSRATLTIDGAVYMYHVECMWRMWRVKDGDEEKYELPSKEPEKNCFPPGSGGWNSVMQAVRNEFPEDPQMVRVRIFQPKKDVSSKCRLCLPALVPQFYNGTGSEVVFTSPPQQPEGHKKYMTIHEKYITTSAGEGQPEPKRPRVDNDQPVKKIILVVAVATHETELKDAMSEWNKAKQQYYVRFVFSGAFDKNKDTDRMTGIVDGILHDDLRFEREMEPVRRLQPRFSHNNADNTKERQCSFYFLRREDENVVQMPRNCLVSDHDRRKFHVEARIAVKRTTQLGEDSSGTLLLRE